MRLALCDRERARSKLDAVTDQCRHGSLNALRPADKQ